jgi:hypothetical protein|nr:MAG TPA: hypothetical protein [Caudoviricetes sp.]
MILHNIGSKIINVGTVILMPGDSMNITADTAALPAMQAFCEMGFVMIEGDKVAPVANAEKPVEETAEDTPAPEEAPAHAKRGRKPTNVASSAEAAPVSDAQ